MNDELQQKQPWWRDQAVLSTASLTFGIMGYFPAIKGADFVLVLYILVIELLAFATGIVAFRKRKTKSTSWDGLAVAGIILGSVYVGAYIVTYISNLVAY